MLRRHVPAKMEARLWSVEKLRGWQVEQPLRIAYWCVCVWQVEQPRCIAYWCTCVCVCV